MADTVDDRSAELEASEPDDSHIGNEGSQLATHPTHPEEKPVSVTVEEVVDILVEEEPVAESAGGSAATAGGELAGGWEFPDAGPLPPPLPGAVVTSAGADAPLAVEPPTLPELLPSPLPVGGTRAADAFLQAAPIAPPPPLPAPDPLASLATAVLRDAGAEAASLRERRSRFSALPFFVLAVGLLTLLFGFLAMALPRALNTELIIVDLILAVITGVLYVMTIQLRNRNVTFGGFLAAQTADESRRESQLRLAGTLGFLAALTGIFLTFLPSILAWLSRALYS